MLADSSAVGADRLGSMQKGWRQADRMAASRKAGGRQTIWRPPDRLLSRQKGWRQADRLAAGRQTGEQAEMLAAGRNAGGRQTVWRPWYNWGVGRKKRLAAGSCRQAGGRQTCWRPADWLAACRLLWQVYWLAAGKRGTGNTCWRHADRVAAGRKVMHVCVLCRQIVRLVTVLERTDKHFENHQRTYRKFYFVTESF